MFVEGELPPALRTFFPTLLMYGYGKASSKTKKKKTKRRSESVAEERVVTRSMPLDDLSSLITEKFETARDYHAGLRKTFGGLRTMLTAQSIRHL